MVGPVIFAKKGRAWPGKGNKKLYFFYVESSTGLSDQIIFSPTWTVRFAILIFSFARFSVNLDNFCLFLSLFLSSPSSLFSHIDRSGFFSGDDIDPEGSGSIWRILGVETLEARPRALSLYE